MEPITSEEGAVLLGSAIAKESPARPSNVQLFKIERFHEHTFRLPIGNLELDKMAGMALAPKTDPCFSVRRDVPSRPFVLQ
ncbi:hypothetical protein PsorP6_013298 [Peronosclerospora sorghi]|uniref:Uncharacterized protein n=1 Tax=Peronosclerospora sorghi TaxID=230839 RepID=A0ACC0WG66_9STRA|nr:hypothetical protein PsorP6_013298 [Peronosclerospora sorghi]